MHLGRTRLIVWVVTCIPVTEVCVNKVVLHTYLLLTFVHIFIIIIKPCWLLGRFIIFSRFIIFMKTNVNFEDRSTSMSTSSIYKDFMLLLEASLLNPYIHVHAHVYFIIAQTEMFLIRKMARSARVTERSKNMRLLHSCRRGGGQKGGVRVLTTAAPHVSLMSRWQRLCTSSLQLIHLYPCRPRPQIRSEQKAQNALCNKRKHTPHHTVIVFTAWLNITDPNTVIQQYLT